MKNTADIKDEYRDSITGGGNEAWLKEMYDTQQKQQSSSYVFIDMNIKRFQYMNNKYGRAHADRALKHLYDITSHFFQSRNISQESVLMITICFYIMTPWKLCLKNF